MYFRGGNILYEGRKDKKKKLDGRLCPVSSAGGWYLRNEKGTS